MDAVLTSPGLYSADTIRRLYLGDGWWDLAPFWAELFALGKGRDTQKKDLSSTRNYSAESTHFMGLLAEKTVSLETGIDVDTVLRYEGDGGKDFEHDGIRFDIKGTLYYRAPHLKQNKNPKHWADCYVLVGINLLAKQTRVFGWETRELVQQAPLVNYGYGPRYSLTADKLMPGLPDVLPSLRKAYGIEH